MINFFPAIKNIYLYRIELLQGNIGGLSPKSFIKNLISPYFMIRSMKTVYLSFSWIATKN